jgi:hypothetical protein
MEIFSNPWFIGIGTSIFAGIVLMLLFRFVKIRKTKALEHDNASLQNQFEGTITSVIPNGTQDEKSIKSQFQDTITPEGILEYLNNLPPFQFDKTAKNYEGIDVKWKVVLGSSFLVDNEQYITMHSPKHIFPPIVCQINIEKYPQLKIMKKGHEFTIEGTIASVERMGINLNNCRFYI